MARVHPRRPLLQKNCSFSWTSMQVQPQQAIGYQKEIKKTLGKTSETDAYLKFEMTSYVKCQTDL